MPNSGASSTFCQLRSIAVIHSVRVFGSLDLPVVPGAGDAVISPTGWVQIPKIACDTCTDNPMVLSFTHAKVAVTKE